MNIGYAIEAVIVVGLLLAALWPPSAESLEGELMFTTTNLPEGVTDTFTFACECKATVSVVRGVRQPHDCPLTETERQAIRDAAADAFQ